MFKKTSLCSILLGLFLLPGAANSQTAPTINTFTATPATINSGQATTLAWTTSNATSCTASGGWTGTKATNGSETVSNITANRSFTLTCTGSGTTTPGSAVLRWTPPTTNTDGSALTNLSNYRVYHGTSSTSLGTPITIAGNLSTYTVSNLSAGTRYFALRSVNSAGVESGNSNIVSKNITTSTTTPLTATRTANVTVNTTTPGTGQLVVVNTAVFNIGTFDVAQWKVRRNLVFGVVPLGTPCDATRPATDNYYVVPRDRVNFNMGRGTLNWPIALCARQ